MKALKILAVALVAYVLPALVVLMGPTACTPAARRTAASIVATVAPIACKLVPVVAGPTDTSTFAGVACENLADAASKILAASATLRSPCTELVQVVGTDGKPMGAFCPAYAETVAKGLGGSVAK